MDVVNNLFASHSLNQNPTNSAPCYSLPAWLDWRLNTEDPTLAESALLVPEPICNLTDSVANESDSDVFSHFVFNEVLPDDDLLYYNEHSALVDGPHGSPHSFVNSSAPSGHPG